MIKAYRALFLMTALWAVGGCALKEAVTPPPPRISDLPDNARALFAQPVSECRDPAQTGATFPVQIQRIEAEKAQLQKFIKEEQKRWTNRRYYLEREVRFYEREVRRTGGSLEIPTTADANRASTSPDVFLRVASDSAFTDAIKRQREREYNERQYRKFYRQLHFGRIRHQERMGLFMARVDALDSALSACQDLRVALRQQREEKELRKNTVAIPDLVPQLRTRTIAAEPLPPEPPERSESDRTQEILSDDDGLPDSVIAEAEAEPPLPPLLAPEAPATPAGEPAAPLPEPRTLEELFAMPTPSEANDPAPAAPAEPPTATEAPPAQVSATPAKPAPRVSPSLEDLFSMPAPQQPARNRLIP